MLPKKLLKAIQAGDVRKFYKSKEWKHKRPEILERDNHECQRCKDLGGYSEAVVVHHIKHLRDHPELALVDSNLSSRCEPCHNIEHPEKGFKHEKKDYITKERW